MSNSFTMFRSSYKAAYGEQVEFSPEQAFLKRRLMEQFAHLKLEGVSSQPGYVRQAVKEVTQAFLEQHELEKLKPETIAFIAKQCVDHNLQFEALVAERRKSLFQAPRPYGSAASAA